MGLHLGWIPNEPGLRAREYAAKAPGAPDPDSPKAAALRAAHAARALWTRLLLVVGLLALVLFGLVGAALFLGGLVGRLLLLSDALLSWLPLLRAGLGLSRLPLLRGGLGVRRLLLFSDGL